MRPVRAVAAALAGITLIVGASGCAASGGGVAGGGLSGAGSAAGGEPIRILAAASLTDAFEDIIDDFAAAYPDIAIEPLVTGGSQELVQQVTEGAPADVLALASEQSAQALVDAGVATDFVIFAENTLVIAVQRGNPHDIQELGDLDAENLRVAICASEAPCGAATQELLALNAVELTGATEESSVSAVLAKAELDEVDAAIVYRSDVVTSSGDLDAVVPEHAAEVINRYPITALGENPNATAFVEFVRSEAGREALEEAGLVVP